MDSHFEGYAIVEIMGHQTVAGYVTTEAFGSVVMFHVVQTEVPAEEQVLAEDKYIDGHRVYAGSKVRISRERAETFVGAASVYRMTPCSEAAATRHQPVNIEVVEAAERKALPLAVDSVDLVDPDVDEDNDGDWNDHEDEV